MSRIRKAWAVSIVDWDTPGDVYFAPTAAKARYQALLDWRDPYPDLTFVDLRAVREPGRDMELPPVHRLVADLTDVERDMISHAYGARHWRNPGYRDHFCASPCDTVVGRLVYELGIFEGPYGEEDLFGDTQPWAGLMYYLSDLGKQVARSMLPDYPV